MSDNIMLSLINNNNRPNHKAPPPPPPPACSFNDSAAGGSASSAPPPGLNPLVKPFAPRPLSGETAAVANPLHAAALRAARARAAEHQVCGDEATS